jgi:transposase-like protein
MQCPNCSSSDVVKKGWAFNVGGKRQRYKCNNCRRKFSEADAAVVESEMPAVLTIDIETLPILGYAWAAYDTNLIRVKEDWCCACWGAKWWGDERVVSDVMTVKETETRNDERICRTLWRLFDEADVIIGQNIKKFDFKKMNTRWWYWGMGPPSSSKVIDTLETAHRAFSMTFNNLDYLANYRGIGKKKETGGFDLWDDFMAGDKEAREHMVEYCVHDVELDEKVYDSMKPWVYNHPKLTAYNKVIGVCPVCFGENYTNIGFYQAPVQKYAEFRCSDCLSVWHSTRPEK